MNRLEGLRHRLNEVEHKLEFIMKVVMINVEFHHPLDINAGKTITVPLIELYNEVKRSQQLNTLEAEYVKSSEESVSQPSPDGSSDGGEPDTEPLGDVSLDAGADPL